MYDTLLHMKALNNTPYMIGTSHGGLRKFGCEAGRTPPELELLMEDLESLGLKLVESLPPSGLELLMEDLESLGLRLLEYPPHIRTSHGDLESLGLRPVEYPHFPSVRRLTAVSPKDAISFSCYKNESCD